ncbi:hypothetical protein WAX46_04145 [Bacillus sp. FJAT-53060]|uniref:hypothetical protein n=1 Tax=Bacillus TaxID=1386 RepID=UPI001CFA6485|nr:hypothetical protein [Bacillus stratosphericus]
MTKAALEAQTLERMLKQAQENKHLSFERNTLQQCSTPLSLAAGFVRLLLWHGKKSS